MRLFRRANRRHLLRQPLQMVLAVTGIALGVAVVLAVDLANHSALRAFRLANETLAGEATHTIVPVSSTIDENVYRTLRLEHGFRRSAPRVAGAVRTPAGLSLKVLGIDPLASLSGAMTGPSPASRIDADALIGPRNAVVLTRATARSLDVNKGDAVTVVAGGRRHTLHVVGLVTGGAAVEGLRQVLITDVSTAQVVLDMIGALTHIDLELDEPARRRLERILPASVALRQADSRSHAMAQMTRAFQINLTALSLLALLIGAFLIYNTQTLFVLNRREALAVWRTLGVTRRQVMTLVLSEAAWLALAGGLLGCLAGIGLSRVLLDLVTRTINDLYFAIEVRHLALDPVSLAKACALGLGASLLATAMPALEASRVRPRLALSRSQVETTAGRLRRTGVALALLMSVLAAAVLLVSQRSIVAGFAGLFCVVMGFAFLVPAGLRLITHRASPLLERGFGWMGLWSARNVLASMSRTQIAVTALTIALAATIGVSVMIQSFRATVVHWLDNYLRADIYVSHAEDATRDEAIDPALLRRLRELPGIAAVSTGRWRRLPTEGEPTRLFVLDVGRRGFENFQLVNRPRDEAWPAFAAGDGVIVSEAYAYHRRLEPGDPLVLPTPDGSRPFEVLDVFYDYGSDRGRVVMHRNGYDRYWDDSVFESMAVYLEPAVDGEALLDRLERRELRGTGLVARSDRRIKRASLTIFDRTFTVTEVLRLLTIIVAFIGILSALLAIQLDRTREFAVLRAAGLTRGELSRVMLIEGGLMGTVSALLAIPLGVILAAVLVFVINKRSFGWSMQLVLPWEQVALALLLGLAAGALAAIYPAWRMNRRLLISNLRYE